MRTHISPLPLARIVLATTLFAAFLSVSVHGQAPNTGPKIEVGKRFPVSVATPATGKWGAEIPFDPVTFGSIRGYCPISSSDPKVVLCTLSLDANFLRLAKAVDSVLAKQPGLSASIIQVADSKGAQRGGYSKEELQKRIEELRKVAQKNKIEHQSFLISATNATRFSSHLGLKDNNNFLIAHLGASGDSEKSIVVKWVEQRNTTNLSDAAIQEIVATLEKSVTTAK